MNQYPGQFPGMFGGMPQMPGYPMQNGFGQPAMIGQPAVAAMGGYMPQQQPMMNPYLMAQAQAAQMQGNQYQYPTVAGTGNVYAATNIPQQAQNPGMSVGNIYTGEPTSMHSNVSPALQQHLAGGAQQSATQPNGAAYPAWFTALTGVPVNQLEQCIRQTLNGRLTRLMEKVGTTVFAKFVTPQGLDQNFVGTLLTHVRRVAQIVLLVKHKPTMVEAVAAAVEYVVYGTLVQELGGIDSPTIQSHEMITGVNLRLAWAEFRELVLDPQAYNKTIAQFQQQYQQATSAQQQQTVQQPNNAFSQPIVQQPSQGLAAIVVNTTGAMQDPMDILAQEAYDKRMNQIQQQQEAFKAQQDMIMKNPSDPWNLGLVDSGEAQATAPAQKAVTPQPATKLYDAYLRVVGLQYLEGVKHHPRFVVLKDGTKIQSLFEPVPLEPMDADLFFRAEDQYIADMEVHYGNKRREAEQRAAVAEQEAKQKVIQQSVESVTLHPEDQAEATAAFHEVMNSGVRQPNPNQPAQQPPVRQPVSPVVAPNPQVPPNPIIGQVHTQLKRQDQVIVEKESALGGEIKTTRNGGVIPSSAIEGVDPFAHVQPTTYYGAGQHEVNLAPETDSQGQLLHENEDAFNQLIHEQEALEAAQLEAMNQQYGNPQSMDEILATAAEQGIKITEPELRVDYLNMEPASRKRLCRDLHIRRVPAYLKGQHNLTAVTKGSHREIVLEKVESVEYLKHETEFHNVKRYDNWNPAQSAQEVFVDHIKSASENVWSESTFVNKLNEKLEGLETIDERDQALFEIVAERPIVEIEDLITNTNTSDEYQIEVVEELSERGVEDVAHVVETMFVNYKRINTSRITLVGDNTILFKAVTNAKTAGGVIEALSVLKQNTTLPTRDVARLIKVFNQHVNTKLTVIFANGWGVTDAITDYDDLLDALQNAYANMTIADLQATLTSIYLDAVAVAFHVVEDSSSFQESAIVGNVESITLMPFFYRDYPIAKADDVGYISPEQFPELVKLLDAVSGGYPVSKLVTLDNVVMTFARGGESEFFITNVDE